MRICVRDIFSGIEFANANERATVGKLAACCKRAANNDLNQAKSRECQNASFWGPGGRRKNLYKLILTDLTSVCLQSSSPRVGGSG
jgi:hypothetical protein